MKSNTSNEPNHKLRHPPKGRPWWWDWTEGKMEATMPTTWPAKPEAPAACDCELCLERAKAQLLVAEDNLGIKRAARDHT